jgi:hypothetical protein
MTRFALWSVVAMLLLLGAVCSASGEEECHPDVEDDYEVVAWGVGESWVRRGSGGDCDECPPIGLILDLEERCQKSEECNDDCDGGWGDGENLFPSVRRACLALTLYLPVQIGASTTTMTAMTTTMTVMATAMTTVMTVTTTVMMMTTAMMILAVVRPPAEAPLRLEAKPQRQARIQPLRPVQEAAPPPQVAR